MGSLGHSQSSQVRSQFQKLTVHLAPSVSLNVVSYVKNRFSRQRALLHDVTTHH
jgi:hypothetical protein